MGVLNARELRIGTNPHSKKKRLLQRGTLVERRTLNQIIMALHNLAFLALETILFFRF